MENKRRKLLAVLFLLFCLLGIAALYGQARQPAEGTGGHSSNRQKVTLIAKSTESAFWKSVFAGASAAGTEYNMELLCQGADNEEDYISQNQMIDAAVEDGADAILFSAIDYEENAAAIDRAAEAGVRIIVIDSDVNSDQVECRIGTDNYRAGCLAGEAALDSDASALNVGIVNFDATTENGQSREKGFRDTILRDDRVTLVDSVNSNSTISAAKEATLQMLEDHPEINVLTTFNEWTTLGVGYAIREAGAAQRIRLVAFDSNVVSVDMLETGEVDALVVQNPYAIGYLGVETAYRLLNGQKLPSPEIDTSTMLVTRENMYTEESQRILFSFDEIK